MSLNALLSEILVQTMVQVCDCSTVVPTPSLLMCYRSLSQVNAKSRSRLTKQQAENLLKDDPHYLSQRLQRCNWFVKQ